MTVRKTISLGLFFSQQWPWVRLSLLLETREMTGIARGAALHLSTFYGH